jgi:hypothetical protein
MLSIVPKSIDSYFNQISSILEKSRFPVVLPLLVEVGAGKPRPFNVNVTPMNDECCALNYLLGLQPAIVITELTQ